jgi:hypothetical protein
MMLGLVFLVGILLGTLVGGAICVHYLRQEIAARIGPTLRTMQLQLSNLESAVTLAIAARNIG